VDSKQDVLDMLRELGIPNFAVRGWEADDLLASLAHKFQAPRLETYVVTSDKDLHQLVRPNVRCLDVFSAKVWDEQKVELKWGVPPSKVVEVQALAGDSSDGVRGVRGIGPTRAAELVRLFGSAEAVWTNSIKLMSGNYGSRRGVKALLAMTIKDIRNTRKLVSLDRKVPLPFERIEELAFDGLHLERARPLFNYMGFRQWSSDSSSSLGQTTFVPGFTT